MSKGMLYWRSFSHWLGGMGVLVFLLAIAPADGKSNRFTMHLLRAESPGPTVGKLAPRMRDTALILYLMYIGLTGLNFIFLIIGKMPVLMQSVQHLVLQEQVALVLKETVWQATAHTYRTSVPSLCCYLA